MLGRFSGASSSIKAGAVIDFAIAISIFSVLDIAFEVDSLSSPFSDMVTVNFACFGFRKLLIRGEQGGGDLVGGCVDRELLHHFSFLTKLARLDDEEAALRFRVETLNNVCPVLIFFAHEIDMESTDNAGLPHHLTECLAESGLGRFRVGYIKQQTLVT